MKTTTSQMLVAALLAGVLLALTLQAHAQGGVPLWINRYNGPGNGYDLARAIAADTNGNVFVTGSSYGSSFPDHRDYATVAYSSAGAPMWTNRYKGSEFSDDYAHAIAVDSLGNVFVTGYSGGGPNADSVTVAYSGAGAPLWTNRYNGPGGYDQSRAIVMDSSDNVVVTGTSYGTNGKTDYATIKYSSAGVALWTNRYGGFGFVSTFSRAMGVDRSDNVFVTGQSVGLGTDLDYLTVAYSAAGLPLWTNRHNGQGNSGDGANAVVVDRGGNVFVTGASIGGSGYYDYVTVAYSTAGMPLWTNRYNGTGNDYDEAMSMTVDSNGNLLVTGVSTGIGSGFDYVTIKYSSSVPPPAHLDFQQRNNQLVLSWTNAALSLQTAPAVTGPFTNLSGATSPYTHPRTTAQQFFRLKAN